MSNNNNSNDNDSSDEYIVSFLQEFEDFDDDVYYEPTDYLWMIGIGIFYRQGETERTLAEVERILKTKKFNINQRFDAFSDTLLHKAVNLGSKKFVDMLLRYKASPNVINFFNTTPLHSACSKGRLDLARTLIEHGAVIDYLGYHVRRTPLFYCKGKLSLIKLLLMHGADPEWRDVEGLTAAEYMSENEGTDVMNDFARFLAEIARLKEEKLYGNVSLWDFNFMSPVQAARYANHRRFRSVSGGPSGECGLLKADYPEFGSYFKGKVRVAKARKSLQVEAHESLEFLSNQKIPHPCTEDFFDYLSNRDLENAASSTRQFSQ